MHQGVLPDSYEQRSQEFQFASRSNVSLDWIAGLFLLDADSLTNFRLSLLSPVPINDYSAISEETAYAAFGQATRRLGERWSVTGGLRLSHETARVTSSGTGSADYAVRTSAEDSWDDTSWRVGAEYAFAAGALFYASVATGFKSGGITQEILPSGELDSFDPEELTAYEAGINLRLPERPWTLRGSAFRYDFRDLQVRTFAVLADNFLAVIDNAAAARAYGIDVTSTTRLTERLTFSGRGLDAEAGIRGVHQRTHRRHPVWQHAEPSARVERDRVDYLSATSAGPRRFLGPRGLQLSIGFLLHEGE